MLFPLPCQENNLPTISAGPFKNILKKGGHLHSNPLTLRNNEQQITVSLQPIKASRLAPAARRLTPAMARVSRACAQFAAELIAAVIPESHRLTPFRQQAFPHEPLQLRFLAGLPHVELPFLSKEGFDI
jgi:hypothetical protein